MTNLVLMRDGKHQWSFVYFHAAAQSRADVQGNVGHDREERFCPPDLVGADVPLTKDAFPEGEHRVTVYGEPATFIVWWFRLSDGTDHPRGLICLDTDHLALTYARAKARERADFL